MNQTSLNRRTFLQTSLAGLGSTICAPQGYSQNPQTAKNKFNVLFIAVDDLRPELGCYDADYAPTPNIDRLASTSIRFTNHFVQVATCGASRFSLLTGRSPANTGATRGNTMMYKGENALSRTMTPGAQTMPELFRRSGYHTTCIGKISHTPEGRVYEYDGTGNGEPEMPHAWDELPTPVGAWKRGWGAFFAYEGGRHREDGQGNSDLSEFKAEKDTDLPDGLIAESAVKKLAELKTNTKPFFLGVGFYKPHLPFVATKKDWEAVKKLDLPIAPHQEKSESAHWHKSGEFYNYDMPFDKSYPLKMEDQLNTKRAYLACVRYTDRQIGKVLDALDKQGLADSTLVVLWGDHGWHLGDSQLWGKHTPFERAVRSPMMIRVPGMKNAGRSCDALVETLDIYPTLRDLCKPSFSDTQFPLDGLSLKPLLNDPTETLRDAALSYWKSAVSIRTKDHRLIVDTKDGNVQSLELYDIRKSPDPMMNLAKSNREVVEAMLDYLPKSLNKK